MNYIKPVYDDMHEWIILVGCRYQNWYDLFWKCFEHCKCVCGQFQNCTIFHTQILSCSTCWKLTWHMMLELGGNGGQSATFYYTCSSCKSKLFVILLARIPSSIWGKVRCVWHYAWKKSCSFVFKPCHHLINIGQHKNLVLIPMRLETVGVFAA